MDRNEFSLDQSHVGVPSVVPKMIFEPMVRATHTLHQFCMEINTMTKITKMIFHLIYATLEDHLLCPN
jgi:hypothetical protein